MLIVLFVLILLLCFHCCVSYCHGCDVCVFEFLNAYACVGVVWACILTPLLPFLSPLPLIFHCFFNTFYTISCALSHRCLKFLFLSCHFFPYVCPGPLLSFPLFSSLIFLHPSPHVWCVCDVCVGADVGEICDGEH